VIAKTPQFDIEVEFASHSLRMTNSPW